MVHRGIARADYERSRAFRQRTIKRLKRDISERMNPTGEEGASGSFATFSVLYESQDGRLCLFEDANGHITAVDSSKMA